MAVPTVISVTPVAGALAGGTHVVVIGTDFVNEFVLSVKFDGVPATSRVFVSATEIHCVTPPHSAGAVTVRVTNVDGYGELADGYLYEAAPTLASITLDTGPAGTAVTVVGTGFLDGATVKFGSTSATSVVVVNSTHITCVVPAGGGVVGVTVMNPDGQSATLDNAYTYPLPNLLLPPDQANYQSTLGATAIVTQLEGGASRFRADKLGAAITLPVQWTCNEKNYAYLMAFYRTAINYGADPFTIGLFIDDGAIRTYTAHFIPGTFGLTAQEGLSFTVGATLEVLPDTSYAEDDATTIETGPDV